MKAMNTRPTPETNELIKTQLARVGITPSVLAAKLTIKCESLERELAEAHAEIKLLKTNLEISFRQTEQAVQDRADEHKTITAQRDRLAEALREIRKGITEPTHHRRGTLEIANEALAAVKGGYQ
jgi:DNA anti-recombination protein RmuC